jgi:peptidoglycan/LPS O-acetylase OafA/YrhL
MPPVAVSVLVAFVLLKLGAFHNGAVAAITGSNGLGELWLYVPHLRETLNQAFVSTFLQGSPGPQSYNPVLWTMQIEFLGSMLVFGAAALFGKTPRRGWAYLVLAVVLWKTYYLGFVIGMVLADLSVRPVIQELAARVKWPVWTTAVLAGLLFGAFPSSGNTAGTAYEFTGRITAHAALWYPLWHTIGAALMVTAVLGWARLQRALNWAPLVELGRQSFALYLTHLIVIATFSSYLFLQLGHSFGYRTSFLITFGVSIVLIFAISWLYSKWVDEPAIRLGKWLTSERKPKVEKPKTEPIPVPAMRTEP